MRRIEVPVLLGLAMVAGFGCQTSAPSRGAQAHAACPDCVETPARKPAWSGMPFVTEWVPRERRGAALGGFEFQNQDGEAFSFRELRGAPVAISFIYTRCENERKCPLVARTLGELALLLKSRSIEPSPALLLITYDPEFDTPSQLTTFAKRNRFESSERSMLLRPQPQTRDLLFTRLNVRVNFNERGVNLHGIQLILLDKQGRYVRAYHSLLWDNERVIHDLAKLAAE